MTVLVVTGVTGVVYGVYSVTAIRRILEDTELETGERCELPLGTYTIRRVWDKQTVRRITTMEVKY